MGYSLHIERRTPSGPGLITAEELEACIGADPTLTTSEFGVEFTQAGQPEPEYFLSTHRRADGSISVETMFDPYDVPLMRKALEVATSLGAVVSGDEGETYSIGPRGVFASGE